MILSFQQKFVFVAIPKTAGHTIRHALRPVLAHNDWEQCTLFEKRYFPVTDLARLGHGHITCQQAQPYLLPGMWESYFKFCFVRNPYDRFVSACAFIHRTNDRMQRDPLGVMKQTIEEKNREQAILFRPQHEFVTDLSGELCVDYVGTFETLQRDFDRICRQMGLPTAILPRINASQRAPYRAYFDKELQEMVYTFYRRDFALFGYTTDLAGEARRSLCAPQQ